MRDAEAFGRWVGRVRLDDEWGVVRRTTRRLRDVYYDTVDWRIARTGYALRVRADGGAVETTLKAFGRTHHGVARRREITERLADARVGSVRHGRGAVGRRVRRAVGASTLRRLFGVRTRRDVYDVCHRGRVVAELAVDRTQILARARRRVLQRVEVEVGAGPASLVARFVATLRRRRRLTRVVGSKFEVGLALAGLVLPRR